MKQEKKAEDKRSELLKDLAKKTRIDTMARKKISGVYFVGNENYGAIKIGYSSNILDRIKTLNTSSPFKIYLYGYMINASYNIEREFHKRFNYLNSHLEWFFLSETLKNELEKEDGVTWVRKITKFIDLPNTIEQKRIAVSLAKENNEKSIKQELIDLDRENKRIVKEVDRKNEHILERINFLYHIKSKNEKRLGDLSNKVKEKLRLVLNGVREADWYAENIEHEFSMIKYTAEFCINGIRLNNLREKKDRRRSYNECVKHAKEFIKTGFFEREISNILSENPFSKNPFNG